DHNRARRRRSRGGDAHGRDRPNGTVHAVTSDRGRRAPRRRRPRRRRGIGAAAAPGAARRPGVVVPVTRDERRGAPARDEESVERVIPAAPEKMFDRIADPHRHHEFEGSGTVRDALDAPARLSLGATFGMSMKLGIPYTMSSTVVEFDENRRIAWQTRSRGRLGRRFGGRIWRY